MTGHWFTQGDSASSHGVRLHLDFGYSIFKDKNSPTWINHQKHTAHEWGSLKTVALEIFDIDKGIWRVLMTASSRFSVRSPHPSSFLPHD